MNSVAPTAQEEKRNKREGYQTSEAGGKTEMHLTSFQAISTTNRVVSSISSKGAVELHLNSGDGVVLKPNDNSEPDALTPISMSPPNRSTSTFTRVIHPPPPPKTKPNVDSEAQERETPPVVLQRQQTTRSADDEDDDDMFGELYAAIVV